MIITVNLPGKYKGSVRHTETQTVRTDISKPGAKKILLGDVNIVHNDRVESECYRKVEISAQVLSEWVNGKPPYFEKPRDWQRYTDAKKIAAYASLFDEGYGVEYAITE